MEVLFFLIPLSLVMAFGGLVAFGWCVRSGQFDDLDTPAERLVREEFLDETKAEEPRRTDES